MRIAIFASILAVSTSAQAQLNVWSGPPASTSLAPVCALGLDRAAEASWVFEMITVNRLDVSQPRASMHQARVIAFKASLLASQAIALLDREDEECGDAESRAAVVQTLNAVINWAWDRGMFYEAADLDNQVKNRLEEESWALSQQVRESLEAFPGYVAKVIVH